MIHYYGEDSVVIIGYCGVFVAAELNAARSGLVFETGRGWCFNIMRLVLRQKTVRLTPMATTQLVRSVEL